MFPPSNVGSVYALFSPIGIKVKSDLLVDGDSSDRPAIQKNRFFGYSTKKNFLCLSTKMFFGGPWLLVFVVEGSSWLENFMWLSWRSIVVRRKKTLAFFTNLSDLFLSKKEDSVFLYKIIRYVQKKEDGIWLTIVTNTPPFVLKWGGKSNP